MDGVTQGTRGRGRPRRGIRALGTALLAVLVGVTVLSGCASSAEQASANEGKAKLDRELAHARTDLGIPDAMLKPVSDQEKKIADGSGGWNYNYKDAAHNYTLLYTQLTGIEQTAGDSLKQQASADLDAFATALSERRNQGFIEADTYQQRLDKAQQDFNAAKTPGDFAKIDDLAKAQTSALKAMWPAYQKLETFKTVLQAVQASGVNASLGQVLYDQDLKDFRDAISADRYQALTGVIDGQILQLMADQTVAMPYIGAALLNTFQAKIDLLTQYGEDASSYQAQHDADQTTFNNAKQITDYLSVGQTINKQMGDMTLPLLRGKAKSDLKTFQALVDQGENIKLTNPYDNTQYPAAYEYADPNLGIGDARQTLNSARTLEGYQNADDEITQMTSNLRALLDNLNDNTPHNQPHQADLQLMQQYGIMQGKTIIISLREQTARLYENGKLVHTSPVTTGRIEKPTPPGLHHAVWKDTHMEFKSPESKDSPWYYEPTKINYGIYYADYGFFLHDAWWRAEFGPNTNLPHWDPAAFNGGSHGCVNFSEDEMAYVYDWTPVGAPIVIY